MSDEAKPEEWTYAGVRTVGGKLAHCWYDANDTRMFFPKTRAHAIGSVYSVKVERKPGGGVAIHGTPQFLRYDGKRPEWVAADEEARTLKEAERLEKRALERGGLGACTLDELRRHLTTARGRQRAALLATIIQHLQG